MTITKYGTLEIRYIMNSMEDFATLLEESFTNEGKFEGKVVKGCIVRLTDEFALVDVGLKSEGRVPLREFGREQASELKIGDVIDVFIERFEDSNGEAVLSREKARREESWVDLEKAYEKNQHVLGTITSRVKGGFTVDLAGVLAFLPGSQVDIKPIRDAGPLLGYSQPLMILKMDKARGNVVVSRRSVLEENRQEMRSEILGKIKEGDVIRGSVKNITDYGAFVDLGGVDGLLHSSDISWNRINHPSEALKVGDEIQVKVIRFNEDNQRISLGMKQLTQDPWEEIEAEYPIGKKVTAEITNITEYGAFAKLKPSGIEGLIHSSEISWTKKNIHPGKIVSTSQAVDLIVIGIDRDKRRISLSLKQSSNNPWNEFAQSHQVGSILEGEIKNITEFGLFVGLPGDIDGMVHMSDLDWKLSGEEAIKNYTKGAMTQVKVLDIDVEKERVSLGIKQLSENTHEAEMSKHKKGDIVTCTITSLQDAGIEVEITEGLIGFIKKVDLARDRSEQRVDRFAVGEKVDAKIMSIEKKDKKVNLSIKAREIEEEKQAMAEFGSSDSGASLGDILGAALQQQKAIAEEKASKKG